MLIRPCKQVAPKNPMLVDWSRIYKFFWDVFENLLCGQWWSKTWLNLEVVLDRLIMTLDFWYFITEKWKVAEVYSLTSHKNVYLLVIATRRFKYNPTQVLALVMRICRHWPQTTPSIIMTRLDLTLPLIASVKVHYHIHKLKLAY